MLYLKYSHKLNHNVAIKKTYNFTKEELHTIQTFTCTINIILFKIMVETYKSHCRLDRGNIPVCSVSFAFVEAAEHRS